MSILLFMFLVTGDLEHSSGVYLGLSYGEPKGDFEGVDPNIFAHLGYAFKGDRWLNHVEIEHTLLQSDVERDYSGSQLEFELFSLNYVARRVFKSGFFVSLGVGITRYDFDENYYGYHYRFDVTGVTHSLGFGYYFTDHISIFGKMDYFIEGQKEDSSYEFNSDSLESDMVRLGLGWKF